MRTNFFCCDFTQFCFHTIRITTAAVQIHNMQPKFNSLFDQNVLEMNVHTAFRFILTTLRVTMFYTTYMFIYIN